MGGFRLYGLLLAAVLACGAAAMLPMALTGAEALRSSYREYAVKDMTANVNLTSLLISTWEENRETPRREVNTPRRMEAEEAGLRDLVTRAGAGSLTRYTVVDKDGVVLADSNESADRMENHGNRPEIRQALAGATGVDIRRSPTFGTDWIYVAVPLAGDRVLRASAALDEVDMGLAEWWRRVLLGVGVSLVLLTLLAYAAARLLSGPLERAAEVARCYAEGDFSLRPPARGSVEMHGLSASLGKMASQLDERFKLIQRQKEEMGAVFENMAEGVLAVDLDSRVMLNNGAAERMLALPSQSRGQAIEKAARHPELLRLIREAANRGEPVTGEIRLVSGDRGEMRAEVHAVAMRDAAGKPAGVLAVLRDVTRVRELEAVRRDFIANVSHELRTPVTTIQSSLETLQDEGACRGEHERFLQMAMRNTQRLGGIIGNLLLLAGMESGAGKTAAKSVAAPLRPLLEEAAGLSAEVAAERRAEIRVACPDGLEAFMNPPLVVQALANLLDNAIKYGPEGGVISLSGEEAGNEVAILVADQGPGIAPRFQSRIFERFYRAEGRSRLKEGSGLGLALVKHIALSQGGRVTLDSEVGRGSVFKLFLPRVPPT